MMIRPDEYIQFVNREYLSSFIRGGGAAVKFVVPQAGLDVGALSNHLRTAAEREGFIYARVDGANIKVHMIDKVFYAIARQIDWNGLARVMVDETLRDLGFVASARRHPTELATVARDVGQQPPTVPTENVPLTLEEIAAANDYHPAELRLQFNQRLQTKLFKDYEMAQEFRIAMIRLCQAQVDRGAGIQTTATAVIEWLTGDLKRIVALKSALIFQKIGRHNARHMLFSLARWLTRVGYAGLVLEMDIRRCAVAKRADLPPESIHYSKPATLDVYELLRQLIDATDELSSCFALVTCAPEFLVDPVRGVDAYLALKLRIWDDVHDLRRANPLSALIRLSVDAPALEVRT